MTTDKLREIVILKIESSPA